jgi:cobalt-zinc-cadmium efflux system membrane fusion protein
VKHIPSVKLVPWVVVATVGAVAAVAVGSFRPREEARAEDSAAKRGIRVEGSVVEISAASADRMGLETVEIVPSDEPVVLRLTGRTGLNLEHVAHVKAQFPGRIVDTGPQLGATVVGPNAEEGTPPTTLCVLESLDLANAKAAYLKSKVQSTLDEDTLRRTEELVSTKVLAEKFLLDARSAVTKDGADLRAARQSLLVFGLKDEEIERVESQQGRELMLYAITSPCSGTITEKNVTRGEYADTSLNLLTIADTSTLWVWGDVYERDWSRVKVGQRMAVRLAAFPERSIECSVDAISPALDAATRCIRIRGQIDNADKSLLADMYGTLSVTVDEGRGSIVVPAEAVVHKLQSSYVLARIRPPAADGAVAFEKREVVAETVDHDRVRVTKGLAAGDVVVSHGALALFQECEP